MKILNVNHTIDQVTGGGTAERTFQMSQHLIRNGIECSILTMETAGSSARRLINGKIVTIPSLSRRFPFPRCAFGRIKQIVAEHDVIHLMGHWTILNAAVYLAAVSLNKPYVFCPAGALPIFGRSLMLKKIYNWIIGRKIAQNADRCIAITEAEKKQFLEYGVIQEKIDVIPNAVDEADFAMADEIGFRSKYRLTNRQIILFFGRLNLIKGPDLLLSAFLQIMEAFPDYDLVFAGPDNGMLSQLKAIVTKNGACKRVHFLGYLGGADKSSAFHAARILTISSRQEAMSIVVLEAGVCGVPALFTDQCGLNTMAEAGCGWSVPATVEGLKKGLELALTSPDEIRPTGIKARDYVAFNFSWGAVSAKYRQLYENLVKSK
jgi:glycosyltransferase involved in cell wall biosynthesis